MGPGPRCSLLQAIKGPEPEFTPHGDTQRRRFAPRPFYHLTALPRFVARVAVYQLGLCQLVERADLGGLALAHLRGRQISGLRPPPRAADLSTGKTEPIGLG